MINSIQEIVEKYFKEEELDKCFYLNEAISGNKIEVFIDSDEGVSFDLCRKVSRQIEAVLDETKEYGEKYTLNVSSPGVGSPLLLPRQYVNNIGRSIEIKAHDQKYTGTLIEANELGISIEFEQKRKEGKKKIKEVVKETFNYEEISSAKIKISFK